MIALLLDEEGGGEENEGEKNDQREEDVGEYHTYSSMQINPNTTYFYIFCHC